MLKRFLYLFPLLLATSYFLLNPSPTFAFTNLVNYQGRAFDSNNKYVAKDCYPVSFKIGRFTNPVTAPDGNGTYTQTAPKVTNILNTNNISNSHPTEKCPNGQVYVENGLFNALLNLEDTFDTTFFNATAPNYGISVSFDGQSFSLWQPFITDNWYYPANQNNSPQSDYYLSSNNTGVKATSWGLSTNHGFWATGGLGAPVLWLIGGANSAANLTLSAGGTGAGWYGKIQASDSHSEYGINRPLKLNPDGGDVEVGKTGGTDDLCLNGSCINSWSTSGSSSLSNMQVFDIGSSSTFRIPAGVTKILVELWGAGGGGGGGPGDCGQTGGGAGAGGYGKQFISVTPNQVYTIGIGTGGSGGVVPNSGTDGGQTYIANAGGSKIIYADGGTSGKAGTCNKNGTAGQGRGSNASLNTSGGDGQSGGIPVGGDASQGGQGGTTYCCDNNASSASSGAGKTPGGGGAGSFGKANGRNGGNGRVVIYY